MNKILGILILALILFEGCDSGSGVMGCISGIYDCEGICDGELVEDCLGECGGSAEDDECGTCDDDPDNDCDGNCMTEIDECGLCSTAKTIMINASNFHNWIYFSFETGSVVTIENPENSLDWDIAFNRNNIKTNGGLSGIGQGCGIVDDTQTWNCELFASTNEVPDNMSCQTDEMIEGTLDEEDPPYSGCYDFLSHQFLDCVKNSELDAWGWFDVNYYFHINNYMMFARDANGNNVKIWLLDYYSNALGGYIKMFYETGY